MILIDGAAILLGGFLGGLLNNKVKKINLRVLGISIMLISVIGVIQNMCYIVGDAIQSQNLMIVVLALLIGCVIGENSRLEQRIDFINRKRNSTFHSVIMGTIFFAVGGLQISGPIAYMVDGDSSVLLLKSMIDFPFALTFGAAYGVGIGISGVFVVLLQLLIGGCAYVSRGFFSECVISQLCAIGYIILFFSGSNAFFDRKYKVNTINLLPAVLVVLIYNIIIYQAKGVL